MEFKILKDRLPKGNRWDEDGACFEAIVDESSPVGWRWAAKNAKALGKGTPDKPLFDFYMPPQWSVGK